MLDRLHEQIAAVAPITGVTGEEGNVTIYFDNATQEQQTAANNVVASFDWSQSAQDTWFENLNPDKKTLLDYANQAIADIDLFLGLSSPTNAQVLTAVQKLAQQNKYIIKRLIQIK